MPANKGLQQITPPSDEARAQGHEPSRPNLVAIFGTALALIGLAIAVHLALWGLFAGFHRVQLEAKGPETPTAWKPQLPPPPNEPVWPTMPIDQLRRQWAAHDSYGWVDRKGGVVHVPIARAIDLTLQRGVYGGVVTPETTTATGAAPAAGGASTAPAPGGAYGAP